MFNTETTHEKFRANLNGSMPAVMVVANWLYQKKTYDILLPKVHDPETIKDGKADYGDILVRRPGEEWRVVEVKGHPGVPFEKLNAYPWTLVDRVSIYDAKPKKADIYVICGSELEQALMLVITRDTKMTSMKVKDQVTGLFEPCYGVSRDLCQIVNL